MGKSKKDGFDKLFSDVKEMQESPEKVQERVNSKSNKKSEPLPIWDKKPVERNKDNRSPQQQLQDGLDQFDKEKQEKLEKSVDELSSSKVLDNVVSNAKDNKEKKTTQEMKVEIQANILKEEVQAFKTAKTPQAKKEAMIGMKLASNRLKTEWNKLPDESKKQLVSDAVRDRVSNTKTQTQLQTESKTESKKFKILKKHADNIDNLEQNVDNLAQNVPDDVAKNVDPKTLGETIGKVAGKAVGIGVTLGAGVAVGAAAGVAIGVSAVALGPAGPAAIAAVGVAGFGAAVAAGAVKHYRSGQNKDGVVKSVGLSAMKVSGGTFKLLGKAGMLPVKAGAKVGAAVGKGVGAKIQKGGKGR